MIKKIYPEIKNGLALGFGRLCIFFNLSEYFKKSLNILGDENGFFSVLKKILSACILHI